MWPVWFFKFCVFCTVEVHWFVRNSLITNYNTNYIISNRLHWNKSHCARNGSVYSWSPYRLSAFHFVVLRKVKNENLFLHRVESFEGVVVSLFHQRKINLLARNNGNFLGRSWLYFVTLPPPRPVKINTGGGVWKTSQQWVFNAKKRNRGLWKSVYRGFWVWFFSKHRKLMKT